jgi:hypothetical protein
VTKRVFINAVQQHAPPLAQGGRGIAIQQFLALFGEKAIKVRFARSE